MNFCQYYGKILNLKLILLLLFLSQIISYTLFVRADYASTQERADPTSATSFTQLPKTSDEITVHAVVPLSQEFARFIALNSRITSNITFARPGQKITVSVSTPSPYGRLLPKQTIVLSIPDYKLSWQKSSSSSPAISFEIKVPNYSEELRVKCQNVTYLINGTSNYSVDLAQTLTILVIKTDVYPRNLTLFDSINVKGQSFLSSFFKHS
jgi:hypothetical protein